MTSVRIDGAYVVPYGSRVAGRPILSLGFPKDSLITMVIRDDKHIMPAGETLLEEGKEMFC